MSQQRIRQLDGVRALAILAVFAHHALQAKLLWMGVDLFFVLSGFLITGVLLDSKHHSLRGFFAHFYERRVRRILVPYLLFLFVASLFLGISWMKHWYFYILLTNFLQPLHISYPEEFGPLWSLAVEEQFYLLWPLAVYFLNTRQLKKLCIFLILLAPILRGMFHFEDYFSIYMLTPFRMDLLAVGGLLCLQWRERQTQIEEWGTKLGAVLVLTGLAGMIVLSHFHYAKYTNSRVSNVLVYEAVLVIALGIMIYALGGARWLKNSLLGYIGRISYSMYLVHYLVLSLVLSHIRGIAGVAAALCLTVAYAAASWHLIESKLLKAGRGKPKAQLVSS